MKPFEYQRESPKITIPLGSKRNFRKDTVDGSQILPRLVVFPHNLQGFIHPRWLLLVYGFLNHQQ